MKLDAKNLFYVMCALVVAGVIAAGAGLYWADGQLDTRAAEINQLNKKADDLDKQIINATKLSSELEENTDLLQLVDEVLPESKTQENIVGELISIAAGRGIVLDGINFIGGSSGVNNPVTQTDKVDGIGGVFSIGISTSFNTSYDSLLELLKDIEVNKRRFEVTDIDITPIKDDNGNVASYSCQLTILTFVRP